MNRVALVLALLIIAIDANGQNAAERGGLWTGHVRARYQGTSGDTRSDLQISMEMRLREYRSPLFHGFGQNMKRIGTLVRLEPEGTVITARFRCSGPDLSCRGDGTARVTIGPDEQGQGHPSAIYIKTVDVDTTAGLGFNPPTGDPMYTVWVPARNDDSFPVTYRSGDQTMNQNTPYITPQLGWMWSTAGQPNTDPRMRRLQGGAMVGSYTAKASGVFETMTASWSICKEGSECPPMPPEEETAAEEPEDDCPQSPVKALMDANRSQRQSYATQLEAAFNRVLENQQILDDNIEAWRAFIDACAIADILHQLVDEVVASFTPRKLEDAVDIISGWAEGDMIGSSGSETFDNFVDILDTAFPNGTPSSWQEGMREKLRDCPNFDSNLTDAASNFVDAYADMPGLMSETQKWINQIRQLDQSYWDLWNKYYPDCLATAECLGLPASSCEPPPPAPE